jgi:hypothetical protein
MADLAPEFLHPTFQKRIDELLFESLDTSEINIVD